MLAMQKKAWLAKNLGATEIVAGIILACSLIGELYRFHGYLLLDLLAPPLLVGLALWKFRSHSFKKPSWFWPSTVWPALFFLGFGWASLLLHSANQPFGEFLSSALYGLRWICLFSLSLFVANESAEKKRIILIELAVFASLLSLAGFLQLALVPDFTVYQDLGWDPHQNRLLSTWFDPNFVGGALAFLTPLFLGAWLENPKKNWPWALVAALTSFAVVLTLSRSSYLAFMIGVFIFGLGKSIKSMVLVGILALVIGASVPSVQSRFESLLQGVKSVFTEDYTLPDASARLRYASWDEGLLLFSEEPLLGQGYNRYKDASIEIGTSIDPGSHAASGSDSSLITVLATTGILGFIPFFGIYLLLAWTAFKDRKNPLSLAFLGGLCGLFIHCIFVNSLLFSLFMAPFWLSAGLIFKTAFAKPREPYSGR